MKHVLVVGASGVAGRAAVAAAGSDRCWTSARASEGADLNELDVCAPDAVDRLAEVNADVLIYTPAMGAVGFAADDATPEQIEAALAVGWYPLRELMQRRTYSRVIAFSAFCELPETRAVYGAMYPVKKTLERAAFEPESPLRVVRAGAFESRSAKGLALTVWREVKHGAHAEYAARWRASGERFVPYFYQSAWAAEAHAMGAKHSAPHRPTTKADLSRAVQRALAADAAPVVNVIGDWDWKDRQFSP